MDQRNILEGLRAAAAAVQAAEFRSAYGHLLQQPHSAPAELLDQLRRANEVLVPVELLILGMPSDLCSCVFSTGLALCELQLLNLTSLQSAFVSLQISLYDLSSQSSSCRAVTPNNRLCLMEKRGKMCSARRSTAPRRSFALIR